MSTTNPTDVRTEWEELQIKYGNFDAPEPAATEAQLSEKAVDLVVEAISCQRIGEGQQDVTRSSKAAAGSSSREDDEDELEICRRRRIEEMKRHARENRFGELYHLGKGEFIREVTEASKMSFCVEDGGRGTWVVVHLYAESVPTCILLNGIFGAIAAKHPKVKFMKAISTDVIPDYPRSSLPTVLLYHHGLCRHQVVGSENWKVLLRKKSAGRSGEDGEDDALSRAEEVEWILCHRYGVITSDVQLEGGRRSRGTDKNGGDAFLLSLNGVSNSRRQKAGRDGEEEEEDVSDEERRSVTGRGYSNLQLGRSMSSGNS